LAKKNESQVRKENFYNDAIFRYRCKHLLVVPAIDVSD